jgi:hypothetical protein
LTSLDGIEWLRQIHFIDRNKKADIAGEENNHDAHHKTTRLPDTCRDPDRRDADRCDWDRHDWRVPWRIGPDQQIQGSSDAG